jgi:hypothetical protein
MSGNDKTDGSGSSKRMKSEDRLVFENNGKINLTIWKKKLRLFMNELYGKLAQCLVLEKELDWMKPFQAFQFRDETGTVLAVPDKVRSPGDYQNYRAQESDFYSYRSDYDTAVRR